MFNLEEFHRKGYQGNGIKVAILDSGLGINYQNLSDTLQTHGSQGELRGDQQRSIINPNYMNIAKIVDFTKGDVTEGESSEPYTDDILLEADYNAIDVNGHGTFVAGLIGSRNP